MSGAPHPGGPHPGARVSGPADDPGAGRSPDPLTMRQAMGAFATGVTVVSAYADGQASGMTANSLTSVSLDPAVLLVSLTSGARTTESVVSAGRFAVSVLSARQEHIAQRFARAGQDHFAGLPLAFGDHSAPVVPDALVHLDCVVVQVVTHGDHQVVFGQALRICQRPGSPLVFHAGRFGDFSDRKSADPLWFG
jgi:flavin reductase (DIM6/NTAB) family NADH-FMN oxidoreductase RutF